MAEIINLRMARKAKARAEAEKRAGENRAKFGRAKVEKLAGKAEKARAEKAHEAGRLVPAERPEAPVSGPPATLPETE